MASLLPFLLAARLHVLYLSFVNSFFSCLNDIDSFSTSTTTKCRSTATFLTTLAFVVGGVEMGVEFVGVALATTSRVLVLAKGLVCWRLLAQGVAIHLRIILGPGPSLAFSTFFTRFSTRFSTSLSPSRGAWISTLLRIMVWCPISILSFGLPCTLSPSMLVSISCSILPRILGGISLSVHFGLNGFEI